MEPTSSILKMFDIIRAENVLRSCSIEQLKEMLRILQHEDLSMLCDNHGHPLLRYFPGVLRIVVNQVDMEKIIRLEDALIEELRERGERNISPKLRYKY